MCCGLVLLQGDNQFILLLPSLIMDLPRELLPRICSSCRSSLTIIHSVVQYYNNFSDIRPFQYKFFLSIFVLHYFKINMFPKQGISSLFIKLPLEEGLRFPGQLSDCGPFADRNIQGIYDKLQQFSSVQSFSRVRLFATP